MGLVLVAKKPFYKRVCLSVHQSVGPSVTLSFFGLLGATYDCVSGLVFEEFGNLTTITVACFLNPQFHRRGLFKSHNHDKDIKTNHFRLFTSGICGS